MSRLLSIVMAFFICSQASAVAQRADWGWRPYENQRYGMTLLYPDLLLRKERTTEAGDGDLFESRTGNGKLLVGALINNDRFNPTTYRRYIEENSYARYDVTYRKEGPGWFVISGKGRGQIFYEKVVFSCSGGLINSFALVYDEAERSTYDRAVEGIESSFRPGANCNRGERQGRQSQ